GGGVQEPDLGAGGDGEGVGLDGQPHDTLEVVVRQRQLARRDPDGDDLARLVGGHEQGGAELAQERRQRARVLVAYFAGGRGALPFGWRGAGVGALARDLDLHQGHGNPLVVLLCDGGLRYMGGTTRPARRPSAGAVPGRWGACLAVRAPPAALLSCRDCRGRDSSPGQSWPKRRVRLAWPRPPPASLPRQTYEPTTPPAAL